MNVLVIKDDKPGHYNQTEGLLLYLKEIYNDLEVEYIQIEIKSKLTRKILRFLLNTFPNFFTQNSLKYLPFFYKNYSIPKNKPDLVISTGGNTSNLNVWFSKVYRCKNILNGALRGLKEELFTYITTVIDLGYKNQIILDVAPSVMTKEILKKSAEDFIKNKELSSENKYYTLLIGGDGAGYKYDNKFYEELIEFVKKISIKKNIKWMITTSRRTPVEIEKKLKDSLKDYCVYFVDYNKNPEKVMSSFLSLSDKVFVTEESSSMISESILSEKDVFTIGVENNKSDSNYKTILDKFVKSGYIVRYEMGNEFDFELLDKKVNSFKYKNLLKAKLAK
jgi:mitochondrial fission protein ELM1